MDFKSQKGFSLIELMIIVAIIGILAAVAVPKFQQIRAKMYHDKYGKWPEGYKPAGVSMRNRAVVAEVEVRNLDAGDVVYFFDAKTGLCFATSRTKVGFTWVPCDKIHFK